MGLKSILKEKATLKRKIDLDEFGKKTFDIAVEINCMIEDKVKMISTPQGEKLVNYSKILTVDDIQTGDLINDRTVVSVNKIKNGRGRVQGSEVYLQ